MNYRRLPRYSYRVTGQGEFPFELLTVEQCWPRNYDGHHTMKQSEQPGARTVWLESDQKPSDRWSLFNWSVTNIEEARHVPINPPHSKKVTA